MATKRTTTKAKAEPAVTPVAPVTASPAMPVVVSPGAPSSYGSAIPFAEAAASACKLAGQVTQELRPIKGAIIVPQVLLQAFSAASNVRKDADNLHAMMRAVIVASRGQAEPGPLIAVLSESQRRVPSWKDVAIWLASQLYGASFNADVWVAGIVASAEPTTSTAVAVRLAS